MKKYQQFLALWGVNVALLYLAMLLLPTGYALGNNIFTPVQAAVFVAFVWNYVLWNAESEIKRMEIKLANPAAMMGLYLALNFATLWVLARFAVLTGFGISSWMHVLGLAFVGNFVQYGVWKMTQKKK